MIPVHTRERVTRRRAGWGLARRLAAVSALALVAFAANPWTPAALAQDLNFEEQVTQNPNAKMLLEADELVYDFDRHIVTARGGVEIYYEGYTLRAPQVTYRESDSRLIASGGVSMTEPGGNIITAREMDITDTFSDGFIESLNVLTVDRARFAANSAERRGNNLLIFRQGVYTACEQCRENPDRPPLWQIKASRIVHNKEEKTVYYRNARLEFFGIPMVYIPYFYHPDPTVKRKSGFLPPRFHQSSALGYGVGTPYFWNLAPNYDITFAPTVYSKQGLLAETEWRHRLMNGSYSIRLAGILQQNKDEFELGNFVSSGVRDFRGSVATKGRFNINSRWNWGWDLATTTDRTFGRDYDIRGLTDTEVVNTIFLTGLSDRNFFDLRGYAFRIQRNDPVDSTRNYQDEQAVVHPVLDHNYIFDQPILGGELSLTSNLTSLTRGDTDERAYFQYDDAGNRTQKEYYAGVAGTFTRASTDVTWKSKIVGPLGQVFTPFAYLKGDVYNVQADDTETGLAGDETYLRAMPAVGLDYRYPFLAQMGPISQTFSPVAQIIVRPDEQHINDLPNEDAQSLVFDDTNLFEWDKFSGYDRQEGGTRANVGFTYHAMLGKASIDALFGQSFQLAGANSFSKSNVTLTGIGSGLSTDDSDYVGRVTLDSGEGLTLTARGRFDNDTFDVNRAEATARFSKGRRNSAALTYFYRREIPELGIDDDQSEISTTGQFAVSDFWSVKGGVTFDIDQMSRVKHAVGLAYDDECFNLSVVYSETRDRYTDIVSGREVFVRFNLRTLGDSEVSFAASGDDYDDDDEEDLYSGLF